MSSSSSSFGSGPVDFSDVLLQEEQRLRLADPARPPVILAVAAHPCRVPGPPRRPHRRRSGLYGEATRRTPQQHEAMSILLSKAREAARDRRNQVGLPQQEEDQEHVDEPYGRAILVSSMPGRISTLAAIADMDRHTVRDYINVHAVCFFAAPGSLS